jgi:hypothetical protein
MLFTVLIRNRGRVLADFSVYGHSFSHAKRRARARAFGYAIARRIDPETINLRIAGVAVVKCIPLVAA